LFIINASDNPLLAKPKRDARRRWNGTEDRREEDAKPKEAESVASAKPKASRRCEVDSKGMESDRVGGVLIMK
jgi:hypothetical protein